MADVELGKNLKLSITFRRQDGQPMTTPPVPDAPPAWSNTNPTVETLDVATDGLTATTNTTSVGQDTIATVLDVGGVQFTASLDVNVTAVPEVLTSITIEAAPL